MHRDATTMFPSQVKDFHCRHSIWSKLRHHVSFWILLRVILEYVRRITEDLLGEIEVAVGIKFDEFSVAVSFVFPKFCTFFVWICTVTGFKLLKIKRCKLNSSKHFQYCFTNSDHFLNVAILFLYLGATLCSKKVPNIKRMHLHFLSCSEFSLKLCLECVLEVFQIFLYSSCYEWRRITVHYLKWTKRFVPRMNKASLSVKDCRLNAIGTFPKRTCIQTITFVCPRYVI